MIEYADGDLRQWKLLDPVTDGCLESVELVQVFGIDADSAFYITSNDEVYAIGNNLFHRLGSGDDAEEVWKPVRISKLCGKSVICFTTGTTHALALTKDREVYAWGGNNYGHIGNGSRQAQKTPTRIIFPNNDRIKQISSADRYNLALSVNNQLYHWGDIAWDCSPQNYQTVPILLEVPDDLTISSISCGLQHAAAVTDNGKVLTWGATDFRQRGGSEPVELPTLVSGQIEDQFVTQVTCSCSGTLALTDKGYLYAWGHNEKSALSTGDTTEFLELPQRVLYMENIVNVASNNLHHMLCAESADAHKFYIWACGEARKEFPTLLDAFSGRAMPILCRKKPPVTQKPIQGPNRDIGKALFNIKELSDLTITLADGEVFVHSLIMKTFSEHFKTLLDDNWSNGKKVIDMRQYNPKAYRAFLQYVYTGTLDQLEGPEIVALCDIAVSYFENELKNICIQMFTERLTVHNVCQLYAVAVGSHSELIDICTRFTSQYLEPVILTEGFEALEPPLCKSLLSSAVKLKNNISN